MRRLMYCFAIAVMLIGGPAIAAPSPDGSTLAPLVGLTDKDHNLWSFDGKGLLANGDTTLVLNHVLIPHDANAMSVDATGNLYVTGAGTQYAGKLWRWDNVAQGFIAGAGPLPGTPVFPLVGLTDKDGNLWSFDGKGVLSNGDTYLILNGAVIGHDANAMSIANGGQLYVTGAGTQYAGRAWVWLNAAQNFAEVPKATLTVNPTTITVGGSATLSWSSTNATSCTGTNFTPSGTSGSLVVAPVVTTNYMIACTGAGGTANASAALTMQGGTTMLLGITGGEQSDFFTKVGRYPDFTGSWNSMGPGGGSSPTTQDLGYPFVAAFGSVDNSYQCADGWGDMNAAARGDYNASYAFHVQDNILSGPGRPYAVRINWEWNGNWFCFSPWVASTEQFPTITIATYIAATRNLINVIRSTPGMAGVKIIWDGPMDDIQAAYYPGDDVVDIIGFDIYFNSIWDGTAQQSWDSKIGGITYLSSFAQAHGKPIFIGEWCDTYTDGVNLTKFVNWMKDPKNNVVGQAYWDVDDGVGCPLWLAPLRQQAYTAAFGGTSYQGTYWNLLPLPSGDPLGFH